MPLDVLGCTRATIDIQIGSEVEMPWKSKTINCDGACFLQLSNINEEFLVGTFHQKVPITSLPFVHTARRSYRLGVLVKCSDWPRLVATLAAART